MIIIGLAGHVDHGKSALVTALTGVATDRERAARERGITVNLQAVPLRDDTGALAAALIDVPGHEDFVRTMVAGAHGVSAALLVVAADEGVMPQTREHLLILEELRIPRAIAVVTKIDLVDPAWAELVAGDLAEQLAGSAVAFEAPALVSVRTGSGLDELRRRILAWAAEPAAGDERDLFRLAVDRIYVRAGIGTIVTGTASSGRVRVDDAVRLLPHGAEARVRSIEVHGEPGSQADAHRRVALGLAGLPHDAVRRGDVLVHAAASWLATSRMDAVVHLSATAPRPLRPGARVHFHQGTVEVPARLTLPVEIPPGRSGMARITVDRPVVVRGGDRFVLRQWSPSGTLGGGWIVDPFPPRVREWSDDLAHEVPARRLAALARRSPHGCPLEELAQRLGVSPPAISMLLREADLLEVGGLAISRDRLAGAVSALERHLADWHRRHPAEPGMPLETWRNVTRGPPAWRAAAAAQALTEGRVFSTGGRVALINFKPAVDPGHGALSRVLDVVRVAGLEASPAEELARQLGEPAAVEACRVAERQGLLVQVERGRWVSPDAVREFEDILRELGGRGIITPGAVRERTGLSRKYLIPLLEWADRRGLTRRTDEGRVLVPVKSA